MKTTIFAATTALFIAFTGRAQDAAKGRAIFQEQCIACHGADGRAQTEMGKKVGAANLTSESVQKLGDSDLAKVIKNGKGKMPAFGEKLSGGDIRAVLAHVRELAKTH